MKLIPLFWLLSGLLLVAGQPNPAVKASSEETTATKPKADDKVGTITSGAPASGSGTPAVAAQVQPKEPVVAVKPEKSDPSKAAQADNPVKNRKRPDTGVPGTAPVDASKPTAVEQKESKGKGNETVASTSSSTSTTTTTTAKPAAGSAIVSEGQSMKDVSKPGNSSSSNTATSSSSSTTTTTTAKTTTSTTTTPKPKKPTSVMSTDKHKEWEKELEQQPVVQELTRSTASLADRGDNGYVVPIVTVLLTVPLAIGVMTIIYRRFRDMWSTRHYRRMDFLVDGMYND
ncbi:hypothetical protein M5D96_013766 [Drosophila gunungcola]|uniref:Uncharacterized protein n=1 Tax=Drosophila gunungcola TaxID=103775 RepID=A0A9P9YAN8_9MUSC|nr:hypothetical protein M5D96_013766 [Drosophila gunungcola]